MEYRVSFLSLAAGMFGNDGLFFIFWWAYFERFPEVGGWTLIDMVALYGLGALVLGLAVVIFGNCTRLPTHIAEGQLDYCLVLPGPPLLHLLASRSSSSGWGDVAFGALGLAIAAGAGAISLPIALILIPASVAVCVAYLTLVGTLAFYMGNAQATVAQAQGSLINFALYPSSLFHGWTKVLLLTVVPAAFVSHLPVEVMRNFDLTTLLGVVAFSAGITTAAIVAFSVGLRRYESGNLMVMRS
jgi:ABC-2 type transport system permease protein